MTRKALVAAAIAFASWSAQAVTPLGQLNTGANEVAVTFSNTTGSAFNEQLSFSLGANSQVTGLLFGQGGDVNLLAVSVQRFSEAGNAPVVNVNPVLAGDVFTFDLGALAVPSGIGFDASLYTLSLSGLRGAGATGLGLTLRVTAVPEAPSWAMLVMGLIGMAGLHRLQVRAQRPRPDQASKV